MGAALNQPRRRCTDHAHERSLQGQEGRLAVGLREERDDSEQNETANSNVVRDAAQNQRTHQNIQTVPDT